MQTNIRSSTFEISSTMFDIQTHMASSVCMRIRFQFVCNFVYEGMNVMFASGFRIELMVMSPKHHT
jgi:hypothetical protein